MFILLAVDDSTPTNPLESLNWGFVIFVVVYALAIVVSICFSGKTPFFTRFGAMLRVKCKTTYFSLLHRQLQLDCNDLPPEAQPIYRLLANKTEEDLASSRFIKSKGSKDTNRSAIIKATKMDDEVEPPEKLVLTTFVCSMAERLHFLRTKPRRDDAFGMQDFVIAADFLRDLLTTVNQQFVYIGESTAF